MTRSYQAIDAVMSVTPIEQVSSEPISSVMWLLPLRSKRRHGEERSDEAIQTGARLLWIAASASAFRHDDAQGSEQLPQSACLNSPVCIVSCKCGQARPIPCCSSLAVTAG